MWGGGRGRRRRRGSFTTPSSSSWCSWYECLAMHPHPTLSPPDSTPCRHDAAPSLASHPSQASLPGGPGRLNHVTPPPRSSIMLVHQPHMLQSNGLGRTNSVLFGWGDYLLSLQVPSYSCCSNWVDALTGSAAGQRANLHASPSLFNVHCTLNPSILPAYTCSPCLWSILTPATNR